MQWKTFSADLSHTILRSKKKKGKKKEKKQFCAVRSGISWRYVWQITPHSWLRTSAQLSYRQLRSLRKRSNGRGKKSPRFCALLGVACTIIRLSACESEITFFSSAEDRDILDFSATHLCFFGFGEAQTKKIGYFSSSVFSEWLALTNGFHTFIAAWLTPHRERVPPNLKITHFLANMFDHF